LLQDTFQLTRNTTIDVGLRYEFQDPLVDLGLYKHESDVCERNVPQVFVGGQNGYPKGLHVRRTS
jgi:hypothetical protein